MSRIMAPILAFLVIVCCCSQGRAGLTLTQAGLDRGLSLSVFASGFPNAFNVGPLGIVFPTSGGVLVSDLPGNVRLFATDKDGQLASSATLGQSYGSDNAQGMAMSGGKIYMAQRGSLNRLIQINDNGTFNQVIVGGISGALGVVTNLNNGHLFVSTGATGNIWDVDPIAKTRSLFVNASFDGMTTDGSILYGAADGGALNGHILGYRISDRALVFDSGFIAGGIDGSALGAGSFAGNIYVNTNAGTIVEVNLTTRVQTLIANGGSRGDFVTVDPTNNTLLLTNTDSIVRLNGTFVSGVVPEPSSLALAMSAALFGGVTWGRKFLKARTHIR